MAWRLVAAVVVAAGAACMAGLAVGQVPWTTVSKDDLAICAPVYAETHRLELDYIRKQAADYCTLTSDYYSVENCKSQRDWLAESTARDALDWYYAGNDHCEGSDYTCFGPGLYNDPRTGEDAAYWTAQFIESAKQQARITPDMDFNAAAFEADRCTAQVWVKKFRAAGGAAPAPVPQGVAAGPPASPPPPMAKPEVTACLEAKKPGADHLAKCDATFAALPKTDPDYGALAIALMQAYAGGGKPVDALRYGDLLAASKTGVDALVTQCVVRVIVKWDLSAGLEACNAAGMSNASALEARGQIHLLAGKWRDAWNDFDAAYKLNGAGQSLYLRGLASAAQGRMAEALKDMADGEAKAPGSAQAYDHDGYTLGAMSAGKPLAPPEAFALVGKAEAKAAATPAASAGPEPATLAASPPPPAMPRFDPDAPRGAPAGLTPAQALACEEDVQALQEDAKLWQGTADEKALKLGMMQRTVYGIRCAGHPQASALFASAEKAIADAAPRAATATTTADQTTPVVTDCMEPIPVGDPRNTTNSSVFRNTCAFPVTLSYCNVASAAGSWAAMFACDTPGSIALISVAANASAPVVFGRQINHFACRRPALPVATYAVGAGLQGYCK